MKRKWALWSFLGVFLGILVLVFYPAIASTAWQDSFDAYSDGALVGKGDWTSGEGTINVGSAYDQDLSGKGVRASISGSYAEAVTSDISGSTSGANVLGFWLKVDADCAYASVRIYDTSGTENWVIGRTNGANSDAYWALKENTGTTQVLAILDAAKHNGDWMYLEFEGDPGTGLVRARVNSGDWSEWAGGGYYAQIKQLVIIANNGNYAYYDDFSISTATAPTPTPQYSISITSPENGTTTADFYTWGLDYVYYTTSTSTSVFTLNAYTYPDASTTTYSTWSRYLMFLPGDSTSTRSISISKPYALTAGTYYADASLTSGTTTLATSTRISFDISGAYIPIPVPSGEATTTLAINCDETSNFFTNSLCHLVNFLFIPRYDDLNQFSVLWDSIKDKPPIGYFTISLDAIHSLTAASSSTLEIPLYSLGDFTDTIRDGLDVIVYGILAFYLFERIKHFEL